MSLAMIPIVEIRENPVALRAVNRNSEEFQQLVDSVKSNGILNPINVRTKEAKDGKKYEVIDGLHRFSAACEAGLVEVPAQILERSDAEALEAQVVANVQKIETKPVEYTKGLLRILSHNPTMTEAELAAKLSRSPSWIGQRLSLTNLESKIGELVNEGKINLANAYPLAKLPVDEQLNWIDRAMTMPAEEFGPACLARLKEIRSANRKGDAAPAESFVAIAHIQKKPEIESELKSPRIIPALLERNSITDPIAAVQLALQWVLNLDPDSVAAAKAKYDAKKAAEKEASERRKAERDAAKAKEAAEKEAAAKAIGAKVEDVANIKKSYDKLMHPAPTLVPA